VEVISAVIQIHLSLLALDISHAAVLIVVMAQNCQQVDRQHGQAAQLQVGILLHLLKEQMITLWHRAIMLNRCSYKYAYFCICKMLSA